MEPGSILVGIAAVISALVALITTLRSRRKESIEKLCKEIAGMKDDIAVIKEASFFGLQGHVESGVNGDVKKAYERLKKTVFPTQG